MRTRAKLFGRLVSALMLAVLTCGLAEPRAAGAEPPWHAAIEAFAAADRVDPPAPGGIVFVGSSSIRLWPDLEGAFAPLPVVGRGFGGSTLDDVLRNVDRIVLPYRPSVVVVYAGENDLSAGTAAPETVVCRLRALMERIRMAWPQTQVLFLSLKPSPARLSLWPAMAQANRGAARLAAADPWLTFIDVATPLLDAAGVPRDALFQPDRLHLSPAGYALWVEHLRPVLRQRYCAAAAAGIAGGSAAACPP